MFVFLSLLEWLWAGWWDELNEGIWKDINNPKSNFTLPDKFWHRAEPNGDERENCAVIEWYQDYFYDVFCGRKTCGVCEIGEPPTFLIRGLCPRSKLNSRYSWTGQLSKGYKYIFQVCKL